MPTEWTAIGVPIDSVGRAGGTEPEGVVVLGARDPDEAAMPATDYLMPDGLEWDELAELLAPLAGALGS
jgi:hypothetical protein